MQRNTMEDFRRDISYRVLKREDGQLSLTALLRDRFHEIEAEVVADLETLKITAAGVEFLRRRAYVDGGRVGIYGTSYGGTASALCLLKYPHVFAAACSCSVTMRT